MHIAKPLRALLLLTVVVSAACDGRPAEYGVNVYSADTTTVSFTLTLTGSLALSMRSDNVKMRPDKSLVLTTPAQLTWARGDGSARIEALGRGRMAVQPVGIGADSPSDTAVIVGSVVTLVRPPEQRTVRLKVEKP